MTEPRRTDTGFVSGAICAFTSPTHSAVMLKVGDATIDIVCSKGGRRATVNVRHGTKTALVVEQTLWSSEDDR